MATLIKKIIIALYLAGKTQQQIRDFARKSALEATNHAGDYPPFAPTAVIMTGLCDAGDALSVQRGVLEDNLKTLTQNEKTNTETITKNLNLWVLIIQGMAGLTIGLVKQLGWSVKPEGTDNRVEMKASSPVVFKANQNVSKTIALDLVNSFTNKKKKPYGVKGWMAYTQIGGIKPTVHDLMTAEIPTGAMKFSKIFSAADIGKQFYVVFLWYDGTGAIGPDRVVYSFTII